MTVCMYIWNTWFSNFESNFSKFSFFYSNNYSITSLHKLYINEIKRNLLSQLIQENFQDFDRASDRSVDLLDLVGKF